MSDIRYEVDETAKIVTGTLEFDMKQTMVDKMSNYGAACKRFAEAMLKDEICTIKATAVCKDGDEFNLKYGKSLVQSKIEAAKHEKVFARLAAINVAVEDVNRALLELGRIHFFKMQNIHRDLKDYYGLNRKVEAL